MGFNRFVTIVSLVALAFSPLYGADPVPVAVSTASVQISTDVAASTFTWRTMPNTAFQPGERLLFVVRWGIITGGRSTLAIESVEPIGGRPSYHIVTEANSSGIVDAFYKTHDRNETWLDVQSLSTLRYEKHIREGKYLVDEVIDLDQVNHKFRDFATRLDKGTTNYVEGPIPPYAMDILGSLYYVRTVPFAVGDSFVIDVYDTKKIWPLVINVKKRETIKVGAGKFDCFVVEPVLREHGIFISKGKKLEVWMTADDRHMPVLMRTEVVIGHVSAELIKFERPHEPPAAAPPPAQ